VSEAPKPNGTRRETLFRVIMISVFSTAMLAYFIVSVFEVPLEADNFTNGFSTSPAGHSALIELLRENKREIKHGHTELNLPEYQGSKTDTLALLQPGPQYVEHFEEEFRNLFANARTAETSVLLVLPKRTYTEADEQPADGELVLWEDVHSVGEVQSVLERTGFDQWLRVDRVSGKGRKLQWQDGTGETLLTGPVQVFRINGQLPLTFEILATAESGEPVVVRYRAKEHAGEGGVLLVSDPDIFTNRFIQTPGAATMALRVFGETPRGGTILVDEDLHGFSTDASLEYLAATPPGLWVTLSVMVLLAVFGWRQVTVLRPQSAEIQDRRARKFSIEGLARMMERAGDHDKAYRRVMWRSRLVLGTGGAQVHGAGKSGTRTVKKGKTGRVTRVEGANSEERLINAAAKVAHQKRTGETEHSDWD
jgi:hypothetical protein